jgi:hypothetical protein
VQLIGQQTGSYSILLARRFYKIFLEQFESMTTKESPPRVANVGGPLIQKIQSQLNSLGFDAGAIDGVWESLSAQLGWARSISTKAFNTVAGFPIL